MTNCQSWSRHFNLCSSLLLHYSSPQDPPAQAPPPLQPLLHPLQEEAHQLQLRRAAAHRHGDLSPGAGRGGAPAAAGGGGAAAHHPAVTHGEMRAEWLGRGLKGGVWTKVVEERRATEATLKPKAHSVSGWRSP